MEFSSTQLQQFSDLLDNKLKPLRKDIRAIKKDARTTVDFLSKEDQELK